MSFSPNLFLANARLKDGFAKTNRFEVLIPVPIYVANFVKTSFLDNFINSAANAVKNPAAFLTGKKPDGNADGQSITRYLALQCEAASLPGKSMLTSDIDIYGPTYKVPYKTQYEDVSLTFICTNEFYERKFFEKWLEAINPSSTYNLRYPKGETTRYLTDITVVQYDDFIKKIFQIKLIDAFPTGFATQPLSWGDEGFHRLTVNFTYRKYEVVFEGSYDLAAAAGVLLGAAGARIASTGLSTISAGVGRLF